MSNNLILIPGLLCTDALYAPQLAALGESYEISVADHTRHESMAEIADSILATAPESFALAGLSMGGYIAFEILRRAPERVERLVLLDTSARADRDEQAQQRRMLIAMAERDGLKPVMDIILPLLLHAPNLGDQELVNTVKSMMVELGVEVFVRQQKAIIGRADAREELRNIQCPTLIIVGEHDGLTPPKVAREMADRIKGATLEIIPGSGHLSTLEEPIAVNAVLSNWLQS